MTITPEQLFEKAKSTHGQIAYNAALADSFLYEIFHKFAGCKRNVSKAIYFTIDSLPARISLVKRVAISVGTEEDTLTMLLTLSEAVKASSNHRNGFVHSFLLKQYDIDDDDFRIKIINPKRGPDGGTQVNEALLAEGEKKSFDLLLLVQDEFRALCQKLGIRPQVSL